MASSHPRITREYRFPKLGSYKDLMMKERPISPPKSHEALVHIHAVSLQYRDLEIADGSYQVNAPEHLVPCSDMAGEIIALGEDVTGWKVGDRVCANFTPDHMAGDLTPEIQRSTLGGQSHGVLTQYRTFPVHSLVKFPDHLSYEEASTLPCAAVTAYNALHGPVPVKAGDYVLVLGTGGVSVFALQIAVALGANVIATSSSDEKLKVVKQFGARHVINYKKTPNWDEEVLKLTSGVGVDHVIEVGGPGTITRSINATRMGGYLHIIGYVSKDKDDTNLVSRIIQRSVTLRGIEVGSVFQFRELNRLIAANPEKTKPVINKIFSFEEVLKAYEYLESQQHVGKVVIKIA